MSQRGGVGRMVPAGAAPRRSPINAGPSKISPQTLVDEVLGSGCTFELLVLIRRGAILGENCALHPHALVGIDETVADRCVLHPPAVLGANLDALHSTVIGREPGERGLPHARPPSRYDDRSATAI